MVAQLDCHFVKKSFGAERRLIHFNLNLAEGEPVARRAILRLVGQCCTVMHIHAVGRCLQPHGRLLCRDQAGAHFQKITLQGLIVIEHLAHKIDRIEHVIARMLATGTVGRLADMLRRDFTQVIAFITAKQRHEQKT